MRFFTSDTHFGHKRIIELCDRPFKDVDEMNEAIIQNWNEIVGEDDTVFHLGDVALGTIADSLPLVGRLNGHKFLVIGNHDRLFQPERLSDKQRERWEGEYDKVFEYSSPSLEIEINGEAVMLSHFPYDGDSHGEDRHSGERLDDKGVPLIHGHTHQNKRISRSARGTLQVHVGMDAWGYRPVSEDTIANIIKNHA